MSTCVIDANIAVKWFLDRKSEQLVDKARSLLDWYEAGQMQFVVPDLFWAEVGSIFWKAVRQGRCSQRNAERSLVVLRASNLPTVPTLVLLDQAFGIAFQFQRSVYDSLYVALASELRTELITADEKLVNALAGHFPVKWLGAVHSR